MARMALGWKLDDLASEAGVSSRTALRYEAGGVVSSESSEAMRAALVKAGIAFTNGGKRAGVTYLLMD